MKRLAITVAASALIPALALAQSDSAEPAADPLQTEQAQTGDPSVTAAPTDPARTGTAVAAPDAGILFDGQLRLSSISEAPIYTLSADGGADWGISVEYSEIADTWERIGSVEDVILSADGRIQGVLAEVGGFLGIGDKLVLLPVDEMKLVRVDDMAFAVVTPFTSEDLTAMSAQEDSLAY